MIPRRIHMFWNGPIPVIVKVCVQRIRALHPEWEVQVLSEPTEHIDLPALSVQHRSDWTRMCVMQHGGVWLDATCVCIQPVHAWVDFDADKVQGFSAPWSDDTLENWAFAAPANSALMARWKNIFAAAIRQGFPTFKDNVPDYIRQHNVYNHMPYLTMHACYLMAVHEVGEVALTTPSCNGPFKYLCDTHWNSRRAVRRLTLHH